ncbi:Hydroxyacylglutathione hydrolase [Sporomusa ovata DSM 2662]|uniref:Metallo-beta-lactamase family protein n=1 Tax=Sporomusa ovata TaxID=2378 RepID=A0A0U1KWT4_9FIRM|nr:MBL fold metallo-hydrolase [Sporomusa ovata]EQB28254.1 Zn-dependent hydrolase [Sporomusa ovata DSM 2662]CQR71796.1 metallo-beta-lactamase family protein [Sporomusa ovata]
MNIKGKVHLIKHDFSIPLGTEKKLLRFVNSIIIFGKEITLIDTGIKDSYQKIFSYIKEQGRSINEIKLLILSHSHPDHIGSANKIKSITDCKVIAHQAEKNWIEDLDTQYQSRMVPGFYQLVNEPVKVDTCLEHNQEIQLDKNLTIRVLHSPGHSKGSISIFFKEDKILFTADSIPIVNDIPNYDNYSELRTSLETIKHLQDYDILLSSWTEPINGFSKIQKLIMDGEQYLIKLDLGVKSFYTNKDETTLTNCKQLINSLGLPASYVNSIVHKAFQSHLK